MELACKVDSDFKFLYPLNLSIKEKIEIIAKEVYRADGVEYLPAAVRPNSLPFSVLCPPSVPLTPSV